jgi:thiosulfate/3-mercaptopyruvate sulfurtransferase
MAAGASPIVSTEWLQTHLNDPQVRIIYTGGADAYGRGHIPGARRLDPMQTMNMDGGKYHLLPPDVLARTFKAAGAADGTQVVFYGDSPMVTGWVSMALLSIGHGEEISWLDGDMNLWRTEKRPVSTSVPEAGVGPLAARGAPDAIVDSTWVRNHLESPTTKVLDVRTDQEWRNGHLPTATLILWQDLFQDLNTHKFKSPDEIRSLLQRAGVQPNQEVVTYCAVGMRASLMFWAARSVGVPARVYVGSWQDWSSNSVNPVVK